jgi:serine/threonine protein kinase/Tfp pilus assembly protein PilF
MTNHEGQQLGNYRLIRLLGKGGFAQVYLGEHIHLETQAAVKVLHTRVGNDDMELFRKEARTIARLEHPRIVRVLEFGIENFSPYLVMTYAPKGTLRQRYPKGEQLPLQVILPYVKQVAAALQYIHDQKLVHRDVKPENLLLDASENILLSDFGIASLAHTTASQSTLGQAGTPHYMAPEQINHRPGVASDQYALGVIVYEWLCGIRPFQGDMFNVFRQHLEMPPPALRERLSTIPSLVEVVVLKALSKDPKRRFASVKAFANALDQASRMEQAAPSIVSATSIASGFTAREVEEEQARKAGQEQLLLRENINPYRSTLKPLTYAQDPLLDEAYALYIQKRVDEAIAVYNKALKANATNPFAWQGYGLAQRMRGLHEEALSSFEHALQLDPRLVTSWNGKGTVLGTLRQHQEALQAFDQALRLEPHNAAAWNGKGAALHALGRSQQALEAIDQALHSDPQLMQAWYNKGLLLHDVGRYREAEQAFQQATTLDPRFAQAYFGRGQALYAMQRLKKALQMFDQAVQKDPSYVEAWNRRGNVLDELRDTTRALQSYERALQLDPHYAPAWSGKGGVLRQLGQYYDALKVYDFALDIDPNFALAWNGKGNTLYNLRNFHEALAAYERALKLKPRLRTAWHNKSLVLNQLGRFHEALDAANEAIRLRPDDADNWLRKAESLKKLRLRDEARFAEAQAARLQEISRSSKLPGQEE